MAVLLEGISGMPTATFTNEQGEHSTVPVAEFRVPRVEPYDRLLHGLGDEALDLTAELVPPRVEDAPLRVHGKVMPDMPAHGAGHTPKWYK